jgi:hypothetical protein
MGRRDCQWFSSLHAFFCFRCLTSHPTHTLFLRVRYGSNLERDSSSCARSESVATNARTHGSAARPVPVFDLTCEHAPNIKTPGTAYAASCSKPMPAPSSATSAPAAGMFKKHGPVSREELWHRLCWKLPKLQAPMLHSIPTPKLRS